MAKRTIEKTAGMYYLHGVVNTESGFKLDADGTFRFFFSYGSLDRYGSGTWTMNDYGVVLQSRPWEKRDFVLAESSTINENFVLIKMLGANAMLQQHVFFSLKKGETGSWQQTDQKGEVRFPLQQASTISIVFEFCPERYTHYVIENPTHNYFGFRFEPWLMEVFFDNFPLKIESYALSGKHPLLKGDKYKYEKA